MGLKVVGAAPAAANDAVRKADLDTKVTLSETSITNSIAAAATSSLTLTTTVTDIAGATVSITTAVPNTVVVVMGVFDIFASNTTASDVAIGVLDVDGTAQAASALFEALVTGTTAHRATVAQTWRVTLAAAGAHTLKLRASKSANTAGSYSAQTTHTTITVLGRF